MDNLDEKYEKKSPFGTPEGYFESLTDRIAERVKEEEKPQKVHLLRTIKPYLGLAGIFVGILFAVQVILPHFVDQNKMILKNGVTEQVVKVQETTPQVEIEFNADFNPSDEEIWEYLFSEMNEYDLIYAGLY